jgi:signal transduction histidine kinase
MHASVPSSTPPASRAPRIRWRVAGLIVGLALLFGCLEAWQGRFLLSHVPAHQFWPEALIRTLPRWLLLAALMPGVMALARRMRLDGPRRSAALATHVAGGFAFTALHLAGAALFSAFRFDAPQEFGRYFLRYLYGGAVGDYLTYWALVGALHVIWHQSEARARELSESQLRAQLAEARLGALRAQLNPHFLFNALNAVSTLALRGDRERLLGALDALSTLLRAALEDGRGSWKSLAEELHFVDRYIEIQTLRFGDRLAVERDLAPAALEALVPSLLLQPIVENAIEHGVASRPGPGRVTIRAAREDLTLVIEVADTGPGFAAAHASRPVPGRAGVGLANTRERLEQLFGPRAALECSDGPTGGAVVRLRLPWIASRGEADAAVAGPAR